MANRRHDTNATAREAEPDDKLEGGELEDQPMKEDASANEPSEVTEDSPTQNVPNEEEEETPETDPEAAAQKELIATSTPTTDLEIALRAELTRQVKINDRLVSEITKLNNFLSKRKQTYKRKRKENEAPRKSLSAYNIFVKEHFAKLAEKNKEALKSGDLSKQMTRVPPAQKVAEAGRAWKALSAEEKAKYEAMARPDKDRYEEQMATYQAPEKANKKRNKTGYNLFFSAHVLRMKNSETGVPSERGSVARIVGDAWKKMTNEERDFYEKEADKQNEMPERDGDLPLPPTLPGFDRAPADLPPQAGVGGHGFGPGDYMGQPSMIHPQHGYYHPPGYGGYDYYGYPPPGPSPSARGQGHDPYAYGPPPPPEYPYRNI